MITHATTRADECLIHVTARSEKEGEAAVRFYAPTALYVALEGVYEADGATHYLYRTTH